MSLVAIDENTSIDPKNIIGIYEDEVGFAMILTAGGIIPCRVSVKELKERLNEFSKNVPTDDLIRLKGDSYMSAYLITRVFANKDGETLVVDKTGAYASSARTVEDLINEIKSVLRNRN